MNDPHLFTPAAQAVMGLLLLLLGRRLFWLFVAAVGFFVGVQLGAMAFSQWDDATILLLCLGCGLVGALLSVVLQRLAVTIAGGIAGGMMAVRIAPLMGLHTDAGIQVAFVAGVLIAALLLAVLFDPALIVLSALTGAVMIAEAFPLDPALEPVVLIVLVVLGIFLQARSVTPRVV